MVISGVPKVDILHFQGTYTEQKQKHRRAGRVPMDVVERFGRSVVLGLSGHIPRRPMAGQGNRLMIDRHEKAKGRSFVWVNESETITHTQTCPARLAREIDTARLGLIHRGIEKGFLKGA